MLPALGIEAGYIDFGENKASGTTTEGQGRYKQDANNKVSGVYAAAVGYLPVSAITEVMGKGWSTFWHIKNHQLKLITLIPLRIIFQMMILVRWSV